MIENGKDERRRPRRGDQGRRAGGQRRVARAKTRITGSESLNDTLRINTLGGKDDVSVDPNAELLITPVIDLGAGQ